MAAFAVAPGLDGLTPVLPHQPSHPILSALYSKAAKLRMHPRAAVGPFALPLAGGVFLPSAIPAS
jgi:hypothetical protein